jgi:hypothetical protein
MRLMLPMSFYSTLRDFPLGRVFLCARPAIHARERTHFREGGLWSGIAFKAYEPPLTGAERGNPAQAQDLNGSGPIGKALRNPLLGHLQIGKCGMA